MSRLSLVLLAVVLVGAVIAGYVTAANDARLQSVAILVSVDEPGCAGDRQFWLRIGNAGEETLTHVDGVISLAGQGGSEPQPVGNFSVDVGLAPLGQTSACVTVEQSAATGSAPPDGRWLARATAVAGAAGRG